jgi:hypothetical protein
MNASVVARDALVASLQREVERLEGGRQAEDERPVSTGVKALDRLLPGGGLKRGTLVEYLNGASNAAAGGGGAATLSLAAAREACGEGRALVVVERTDGTRSVPVTRLYPPAAMAWGIDPAAMLVLRTTNEADAVWAFDQALRCPGVGAVWGAWERLDVRDFRRLQLAAEMGGTIGLLVRPARVRGQPTWAEVRWEVGTVPFYVADYRERGFTKTDLFSRVRKTYHPHPNPLPKGEGTVFSRRGGSGQCQDRCGWRLEVGLVRCRGAAGGKKVLLELDEMSSEWREVEYESAHCMSVFAELADSAARRA